MSKVIIALDKMPETCGDCPVWKPRDDLGQFVGECAVENGDGSRSDGRPYWCPICDVPPYREYRHGDNGYDRAYTDGYNAALADLHVGYHPMSQ